jgi:guanosine-3',5'-bis(diphosphate) 3'-pyrophosphohydrolase
MAQAIEHRPGRGVEERKPEQILDDIIAIVLKHDPEADIDLLWRAYRAAADAHAGQMRQTGDPYIVHPLAVAEILAGYGLDCRTIAAALLHDTVEDTDLTLERLRKEFGDEVAMLIDGVTKLDKIKFSSREEASAATIRKMAVAMAKDMRVLLIKLADRTHNIRTMDPLPEAKQQRVASETLDVYAPIAHRLGVQDIKHEMEETCFPILYPKRSTELEELVRSRAPQRESYIRDVIEMVAAALGDASIEAEVSGRPKHLYSIYRKMVDSGLEFKDIYDLIGIRVIVPRIRDCYAALGLVHSMWPPIPGRFKDYIAMPKFNLYQSLHTTVVGPDGKALEVQIRNEEMHTRAEFGVAAHWRYKDGEADRMPLIKDIRILQEDSEDPSEFLADLKLDLYQDEVFALTPKGRVIDLPKGATPVDFAYRIHTDVGHHCVGAKVNGRLVALSTELESGDIVEILTSKSESARPSRDWLEFTQSSRATSKIKQWFRRQRRETAVTDGREAVIKALRRDGLPVEPTESDLTTIANDLGFSAVEGLYGAVGDGRISPQTVSQRLARQSEPDLEEESTLEMFAPPPPPRTAPSRGVIVEGLDDMLVRMARCCSPMPGDDIIGFVTVGRGVSVHRADCANIGALEEQPERMIEVSWAPEQTGSFFVWIQVEALDRSRLLRDVTSVLSDLGVNIHSSSSVTGRDRIALLRYEVEMPDATFLERVLSEVGGVDGVFDAYRLVPGG